MATTLRSSLDELAPSWTDAIREASRTASLDELLGHADGAGTRAARAGGRRAPAAAKPAAGKSAPKKTTPSGRLRRRSPEEIAGALDGIVALVKKNKEGLRAEQIRAELGLEAKELPRILKEGLATKKLRSKGQKRATTYFA
jgi:hypothetical protein